MNVIIKSNEDFVVKEVISDKFLRKFVRTPSGMKRVDGPYSLYLMRKNGENTKDAVRKLAGKLGLRKDSIGYAGLKDKNAITYQYITIRDSFPKDLDAGNICLSFVAKAANHISIGDLKGNDFEITLHDCEIEKMEDAAKMMRETGFPNFFGCQRFGKNMDNYLIGKCLVKREFDKAERMILSQGKYAVSRNDLKFFIHSYQSWIFNSLLKKCIEKGSACDTIMIVGYGTKANNGIVKDFLDSEKITPHDFMIDELKICCRGGERKAFIKTDIRYAIYKNMAVLKFFLPKGCYATSLLEEIKKI
ncbi:MAG: tRNA pseudouridine(13) synthase TruD [Candidatus Aenigmarchaeota archaeon]|nr:tRNA pseudouridine(13) synthase TruD [Candidatus Aenigmarchaeota archaeon]MDI6722469.1 tRNA pseudouridine(13) synthase TruD [Candidatus Aenigmarchaeota archaeon]